MKPTVCFITSPSPFLLDERVFPALGILKVAAVAERLGYPVEHLDLNGVENYEEAVKSHLCRANIYAITATTPQMVAVTKIVRTIRYWLPKVKIILGGPHPTLVHAALKHSVRAVSAMESLIRDFDVVVCGDGEDAIGMALQPESPRVIDADDPKSFFFLSSQRLAELPFPARHLVDLSSYHYQIDRVDTTPVISQLGCSYGCNFCSGRDSAMLRRVRLRPVEHVIAELKHLHQTYGYRGWMFFDDEVNLNNNQFISLMGGMIALQDELGVEFRCRGFVKANLFTDEQGKLMYKAGFRKVMCGFESGSDRILKNINKRATKEDNTRAMDISHKHNLGMKALMSLGHPGESPETIYDTMQWLMDVEPDDFDVTIITAYPGSPYYDRAVEVLNGVWVFETNGDKLYMIDVDYTQIEDFYKGSMDAYKSYVYTDFITASELVRLRDQVERQVRAALEIPFYPAGAGVRYEASMGQLPGSIYRKGNA